MFKKTPSVFCSLVILQQMFIEACNGLGPGEGIEDIIVRPDTVLNIRSPMPQPGEGDSDYIGMFGQVGETCV